MADLIRLPIQPFDDTLRERLFKAIQAPFEEHFQKDKTDYDPDTCGEAADRVIALLVGDLLGVEVTVLPQRIIGNGTLGVDVDKKNV